MNLKLTIKEIEQKINTQTSPVNLTDEITGISYDSRTIKEGDVFVCLVGEKTDGHNYVDEIEKKGARLIIAEKKIKTKLPVIYVENTQIALAQLSNLFYTEPSKKIRIIGITGTNGKTTTTHLIQHIFEKENLKTAVIGTLGTRESTSSKYYDAKHTTPQAPELQKTFLDLKEKDFKYVAMEVSSHALALNRVHETNFASALITNVTQDHLDFHLTMEEYWRSKSILFKMLKDSIHENKYAILNADDNYFNDFKKIIPEEIKVFTYGIKNKADFQGKDIHYEPDGLVFTVSTPSGEYKIKSKLNGLFNIYNILGSIAVSYSEGIKMEKIQEYLKDMKEVEGRFQIIHKNNSPICIVDYAHTPDGLENILKAAKLMAKNGNKLICVFGCGGDRDPTKRPKMGKISESLADFTIITSDNPRSEDPKQIISDILAGIENTSDVMVESDRREAIKLALNKAEKNDIVVVAGKGHEDYQILKNKTVHFDDREEILNILNVSYEKKSVHLGIIGNPLEHSLSPLIHNAALKYLKINGEYKKYEVKENELEKKISELKESNIKGFNITIPYKTKIIKHLDELTETASLVEAVNTVIFKDGKTIGENTDVFGFWDAIPENYKKNLNGKEVSVIGCGGSACAVCIAFLMNKVKIKTLKVYGRDESKLKVFLSFLKLKNDFLKSKIDISGDLINKINLSSTFILINTTPVGMYPDINKSPVENRDLSKLPKDSLVYDLIYNPEETLFLKDAKSLDLKILNGKEMLIRQGALSLSKWLDLKELPVEVMRRALS